MHIYLYRVYIITYIHAWLIVYDIYTRTLHAPIRSFSAHREVLEPPRPGFSLDHPDPTGEVPARSQPGEDDSRAQAAGRASAAKATLIGMLRVEG